MISDSVMGIDSSTTLSWPPTKRPTLTPVKLKLREERKRIIRALDAKYSSIHDHEKAMRKFVLIRNNLRRLQREAREDKLSRHRANMCGSRVSNLSPSYLSATTRSPSPLRDYPYVDSPAPFIEGDVPDEEIPPFKRPKLFFFDDDKENEKMETELQQDTAPVNPKDSGQLDDAQAILQDLYETCASDGLSSRAPVSSCSNTCPSTTDACGQTTTFSYSCNANNSSFSNTTCSNSSCSYSVSMSTSCTSVSSSSDSSSFNSISSGECEWHSKPTPYHFTCGHTSLLGNGLQSVVFHSLITSLES